MSRSQGRPAAPVESTPVLGASALGGADARAPALDTPTPDAPAPGTRGYDADDVAAAARARRLARASAEPAPPTCDACDSAIAGEVAGRGLLVFPRGDGVVREEPPLCERCALAVGITALWRFAEEEEEG